jgi:hypothetical protein
LPITYTNWATSFINNSQKANFCAYLLEDENLWDADACQTPKNFICKISKGIYLPRKYIAKSLANMLFILFLETEILSFNYSRPS